MVARELGLEPHLLLLTDNYKVCTVEAFVKSCLIIMSACPLLVFWADSVCSLKGYVVMSGIESGIC